MAPRNSTKIASDRGASKPVVHHRADRQDTAAKRRQAPTAPSNKLRLPFLINGARFSFSSLAVAAARAAKVAGIAALFSIETPALIRGVVRLVSEPVDPSSRGRLVLRVGGVLVGAANDRVELELAVLLVRKRPVPDVVVLTHCGLLDLHGQPRLEHHHGNLADADQPLDCPPPAPWSPSPARGYSSRKCCTGRCCP